MQYDNITEGTFIDRTTRFTASVEINGQHEACHLKSTARMKELLVPGARVWVQSIQSTVRRTAYDVISVNKDGRLINIDSLAPNKLFLEWAEAGNFLKGIRLLRSEVTHGDSRFDFYMETEDEKAFVEVKGVTLFKDGLGLFPDAPTERGIKHIEELIRLKQSSYGAHLVFIVQLKGPQTVVANRQTHEAFYQALVRAQKAGVGLHAVDCVVNKDSITADQRLKVRV